MRGIRRLVKIAALLLGAFALLAAAVLLALYWMFPPERIQALALKEAQERLHREIRLASAELGLWGVSLHELEISQSPDFKAGVAAKARFVRVRPKLAALLRRRLEISDILLSGWECRINRRRDGTWSFQDSGSAKTAGAPSSSDPSPALGWEIGGVRIEKGVVLYSDEASHAGYALRNVEARARRVRPRGKIPLALSADYSGKGLAGRVELEGGADLGGLEPARMSADWTSLKIRHQGLLVEGSGRVRDFSSPELSVKAGIPRQRLAPRDAARWPSQLPMLIPVHAQAEIKKKGSMLALTQGKILWNSLRAEVEGKIALKEKGPPELHLRLKTGEFSLADMAGLLPVAQKIGPKGQGHINLSADGPADAPSLTGEASVKGVSVSYEGQSLNGLEASAKFSPLAIAGEAKGVFNRGKFQLKADLRDYRKAPDLRINGEISELDLGGLSKDSPAPSTEPAAKGSGDGSPPPASAAGLRSSGKLVIGKIVHPKFTASKSTFEWNLKDVNLLSRVTGSARMNIGAGRFDDLKNASRNQLVKTLLLPITILQKAVGLLRSPLLPAFDRVTFKEMAGDYAVQNGIVTIREFHADSSAGYITATGKVDLAKETLDLSGRILPPGRKQPLRVTVGCTFSEPCPKLDLGSIIQQPEVNKAVEQGKKLLENLFK